MFSRFTDSARDAITEAARVAAEGNAEHLREEHLALGVLAGTETPATRVLAAVGCEGEARMALVDELTSLSRRGGLGDHDVDALRDLGIDVGDVLDRLEQVAGEAPRKQRRKRTSWSVQAKRVMDRTVREVRDLGQMRIDDSHLLLALTGDGVVAETMAKHGVAYADVRRALAQAQAS